MKSFKKSYEKSSGDISEKRSPSGNKRPSYRELYPEQFMPLPDEIEPKSNEQTRKHAVKLDDIGSKFGIMKGKELYENSEADSAEFDSDGTTDIPFDAVNLRKKSKMSATAYAMKIVSASTVNQATLRKKLASKEYTEEECEDAVNYVKKFGYIDDARLAQNMAERLAERLWGKYKICRYLASRGFDQDDIEAIDFSEIDFARYCARLISKYTSERRDAMLRAVKNAGYTSTDLRLAREILEDE